MGIKANETTSGDWPAYLSKLVEGGVYPSPFDQYPDAFNAACLYLIDGYKEAIYVSKDRIAASYTYVLDLQKEDLDITLENSDA